MRHTSIANKAKSCNFWTGILQPRVLQIEPLFLLKPLKSLLLAGDPLQATGPAHRLRILRLHAVRLGPAVRRTVPGGQSKWESEEKWVEREEEIKGAAGQQNVRDQLKSTGLETLLTPTHTLHAHILRHSGACFYLYWQSLETPEDNSVPQIHFMYIYFYSGSCWWPFWNKYVVLYNLQISLWLIFLFLFFLLRRAFHQVYKI